MDANPIMLIVIAIGLLIGGFILAYTHIKVFRDAVNDVGRAIKGAFLDAFNWVKGAVTDVVNFIGLTGSCCSRSSPGRSASQCWR